MFTPLWGQSPASRGQHWPARWPATRPGWLCLTFLWRGSRSGQVVISEQICPVLPGSGVGASESFGQEEAICWRECLDQVLWLTLLERGPQEVRVRLVEGPLQQLGVSVGQGGAEQLWVSLGDSDTEQLGPAVIRTVGGITLRSLTLLWTPPLAWSAPRCLSGAGQTPGSQQQSALGMTWHDIHYFAVAISRVLRPGIYENMLLLRDIKTVPDIWDVTKYIISTPTDWRCATKPDCCQL